MIHDHDHNKVNYNGQFSFGNIEYNQHLERNLQKVADDNPDHTLAKKIKELISLTIKEQKDAAAVSFGFYCFIMALAPFSYVLRQVYHAEVPDRMQTGWKSGSSACRLSHCLHLSL